MGMWWLDDIIVPAVLILGVSCFVWLVRSSTRRSVRKNTRSAEDLYPLYADSTRKQRKYAKEHRRRVARRRGQQAAAIIRPAARQADTNSCTGANAPPFPTSARHHGHSKIIM